MGFVDDGLDVGEGVVGCLSFVEWASCVTGEAVGYHFSISELACVEPARETTIVTTFPKRQMRVLHQPMPFVVNMVTVESSARVSAEVDGCYTDGEDAGRSTV